MLHLNQLIGFGVASASGPNIQFVGGNTSAKLGGTSGTSTIALSSGLTGGISSAVSSGDLVIAVFGTGSQADRTLSITDGTNNYTLIGSEYYVVGGSYRVNLRVAYKFVSGDTATTFGPTGNASDAGAMAVYVFRGVNQSTPIDVTPTTSSSTSSVLVNPAAITPATTGSFVVAVGAGAHQDGIDTYTASGLTNFFTRGGSDDDNDVSIGIGHVPSWSSGVVDPAAWTFSGSDSSGFAYASVSFALRPA
jgi:hypothetical protein